MDFKPTDIIEFCDEEYLVLENYGDSGKVQVYPNGLTIDPFYWNFHGTECELLKRDLVESSWMRFKTSSYTNKNKEDLVLLQLQDDLNGVGFEFFRDEIDNVIKALQFLKERL